MINDEVIYEVEGLKVSAKMRNGIEKMEKKLGKLNKYYFIETYECNRSGKFYDGCHLTCDILGSLRITVAHDGTISNWW